MDGAIHLLRLQFYSLKISNLSESPVYPDHVTSVEGLRYLRLPQLFDYISRNQYPFVETGHARLLGNS